MQITHLSLLEELWYELFNTCECLPHPRHHTKNTVVNKIHKMLALLMLTLGPKLNVNRENSFSVKATFLLKSKTMSISKQNTGFKWREYILGKRNCTPKDRPTGLRMTYSSDREPVWLEPRKERNCKMPTSGVSPCTLHYLSSQQPFQISPVLPHVKDGNYDSAW